MMNKASNPGWNERKLSINRFMNETKKKIANMCKV